MSVKIIFFEFLILFFVLSDLWSQKASFVNYGVEHGMTKSQVQCVTQGKDGKLWIGTISGISVYNGINFKNYGKQDGLAEDWVTSCFRSSKDNLWFGHWGGSITKYNVKTEQFEDINIGSFNRFQTIVDFEQIFDSSFFFASNGSGLYKYDLSKDIVKRIVFHQNNKIKRITCLFKDPVGNLWIGTNNKGLYHLKRSELKDNSNIKSHGFVYNDSLYNKKITDIQQFNKKKLWVSTAHSGIYIIYHEQWENFQPENSENVKIKRLNYNNISSKNVTSLEKDGDNQMWVGTSDNGAIKYLYEDNKLVSEVYNINHGLNYYDVNTIFKDRENSIWIGTDVGLNQYLSDYFLLYDHKSGLNNNMVRALEPVASGHIWIGTNKGLSKLINTPSKTNDDVTVKHFTIEGTENVPVLSVFQDSDKNLWFATEKGKLYKKVHGKGFEEIHIKEYVNKEIRTITEDNNGYLWLGTKSGAIRLNKKNYRMSLFTEKDSLGGNNVYKLHCDSKGRIWFAILGGKLTCYDHGKFKTFGKEKGLKSNFILSIAEDKNNNLWFGTYGEGLYKYDGKDFKKYSKKEGMYSAAETPYAIIADKNNNIWLGTNYGVEKFNQESKEFTHYGNSEGFPGVEVNPNAISIDNNNNIWFGTILGAVKYNPLEDKKNTVNPKMLFKGVKVNRKITPLPYKNKFQPNENHLTFRYAGISLRNSSKVRYKYQLKGFDQNWSDKVSERKAVYANLPAGNYTFKVKSFNADGVQSKTASYDFKITVPFYQSTWFYSIQVFIIVAMLIFAVFYGRKTGGSRLATVLASIALIIVFEYINEYVENNVQNVVGGIVFIKVTLNALLAFLLFPIEKFVKRKLVKAKEDI